MKKIFILKISVFVLMLLGGVSCYNDVDLFNMSDELKMDQALVIPIGNTSATTMQILQHMKEGRYWVKDTASNEVYFEKHDTVIYKYKDINLSEKIFPSVQDYPLNNTFLPIILPANTQQSVIKNGQFFTGINFDTTNERLDSVYLSSITVSCNLTQQDVPIAATNVKVRIIFPVEYFYIPGNAANSITFYPSAYNVDNDYLLNNVKLYFPNGVTSIPFKTEISYDTKGGTAILNTTSKFRATYTLKNINYKVAYGYFNPASYSNPTETRTMDYFSYLPEGYLRFANPQLFMTAVSNIGTHLAFKYDYVKAYLSTDPTFAPIYASFDGSQSFSQTLNKPSNPGNFSTTQMKTFDKDFGQTYLLFDSLRRPDVFEYKFTTSLDKDKINADPTPDYIVPNSHINLYTRTKITLHLNEGSFYQKTDTSAVGEQLKLELNNNKIKIDSCFIILKVKNAFPCQAKATIQMLDSTQAPIINDFVKEYTINSAKTDETGTVIKDGENNQIIKILVKQPYLDDLEKVKYFVTKIKLTGENGVEGNKKIHITQDNYIYAAAGFYIKFNSVIHTKQ